MKINTAKLCLFVGSWHESSFVQFLYMCQNHNGSNAPVHWTQAAPLQRERIGEHWTCWDLDTCPFLSSFYTCVKILTGLVLLCTGSKPLPLKGKALGSTGPVEILTHVHFCPIFVHVSKSQWVQCSCALDSSYSPLGPVHRSTEHVQILTHVQFLYMCQNLNGSNAPVHWTQAAPHQRERIRSSAQEHWTRWDLDTCPIL